MSKSEFDANNEEMFEFDDCYGGPLSDETTISMSEARSMEKKEKERGYVQYSLNGNGFLPERKTFPRLEPGVWRFEVVNNTWTYMKHNFFTDELLRLPDSKSDEVIAEISRFWTLKDVFKKHGFTHKRGFLLHGPPGSGKTSTLSMVSKAIIDMGGIVFFANAPPSVVASLLHSFREIEPDRPALVIMEDLDAIIKSYGESTTLAILDGEESINNVVYLATTNYPEDLDGRITNRPSRFDKVVEIGMPNADARKVYINSRNLDMDETAVEYWVNSTEGLSIAHIKELIVSVYCLGSNMEVECERIRNMAKTPTSAPAKKSMGFGSAK